MFSILLYKRHCNSQKLSPIPLITGVWATQCNGIKVIFLRSTKWNTMYMKELFCCIIMTIHLLVGRLLPFWLAFFINFYFPFFVFSSYLFSCFFFLSIVPEEEVRAAEEKFEESKEICYNSMLNLIETADVSMEMYFFSVNTNLLLIMIPCLQLYCNCLIWNLWNLEVNCTAPLQ